PGLSKTVDTPIINAVGTENSVAWLIRWNGLNSVQFLSTIMQQKVKVRYAELPFKAGNEEFDKGTLIITHTGNQSIGAGLGKLIAAAAQQARIGYTTVSSSFVDKGFDFGSEKVHGMQAPKIGLLAGDGVSSLGMGEVWHFFDMEINYPVNIIWANDLTKNMLRD